MHENPQPPTTPINSSTTTHYDQKQSLNHLQPHTITIKPSATTNYHQEKFHDDPQPPKTTIKLSATTHCHHEKHYNHQQPSTTTIKTSTTTHYQPGKSHINPQPRTNAIKPSTMRSNTQKYIATSHNDPLPTKKFSQRPRSTHYHHQTIGPYINDVHTEGGWGSLEICHVFVDSIVCKQ